MIVCLLNNEPCFSVHSGQKGIVCNVKYNNALSNTFSVYIQP